MSSIILLGIKHCGKSTQGKLLAKHFSCPFFDTDDEVTALTGKSPREIYSELGKEAFIEAEKNACQNLVEKILSQASASTAQSQAEANVSVIATGGGICNNPAALEILHKIGKFVFFERRRKNCRKQNCLGNQIRLRRLHEKSPGLHCEQKPKECA